MEGELSMASRAEIVGRLGHVYVTASKKAKGQILVKLKAPTGGVG